MTEEIIQGTDEWFAARLGKVTASRVADVIARTKSGYGASRANYMAELIAERLTNTQAERFSNAAMAWGTEQEDNARQLYAYKFDLEVETVGFVPHPRISMSGASPDGHIANDGSVEIKAPNTATHIDTLISGEIPGKYQTQMLWQMACSGRAWCDFVSFDPRLPAPMRLFVKRLHRDDIRIAELEKEVSTFLAELDAKIVALEAAVMREAA
jgi:putative phage-type endonuclease